jgi:hypothetical protein
MLTEIEDKLVRILTEKIQEVQKENIVINEKPSKLPALVISSMAFKFKSAGLVENVDEGNVEVDERFSGDGNRKSFRLEEKPLKGTVRVQNLMQASSEDDGYSVNYEGASLDFRRPPSKGRSNIIVKYMPEKRVVTLKTLKVRALYSVEVWSLDRVEADSIAEKVVKTLLTAEDEFMTQNIRLKPIEGLILQEEDKVTKVQLKYHVERELRIEQVVGPMQRIEITGKNL